MVARLGLGRPLDPARLLLLSQLDSVLRPRARARAMLAGRVGAPLDAALLGQAALALQEELLALAAALLALWSGVGAVRGASASSGGGRSGPAGLTSLTVVTWEAGGLRRADVVCRREPAPLALHLDPLDAVLHALAGGGVSGHLSGGRSRLARALEPGRAADSQQTTLPSGSVK